jgi:hypothetical protein
MKMDYKFPLRGHDASLAALSAARYGVGERRYQSAAWAVRAAKICFLVVLLDPAEKSIFLFDIID